MAALPAVTIPVFIGFDPRQPVSFTALVASIVQSCSMPVSIHPIVLDTLAMKRQGLTPFTFSRFMVPHLMDYRGFAIFMDIDMLARGDLAELWALRDHKKAVQVVNTRLGFERTSLMLLNCTRLGVLTPEYIQTADKLHALGFVAEDLVGELPKEWNYLVGYDDEADAANAKIIHYTQGVPAYPETKDCLLAGEWIKALQRACSTVPWVQLMGPSVHAKPVMERLASQQKEHAA